jgi:hypothetical protein
MMGRTAPAGGAYFRSWSKPAYLQSRTRASSTPNLKRFSIEGVQPVLAQVLEVTVPPQGVLG